MLNTVITNNAFKEILSILDRNGVKDASNLLLAMILLEVLETALITIVPIIQTAMAPSTLGPYSIPMELIC